MSIVSAIGIIAALLTTSAFVPQVYKTMKTRSTEDLSLGTFSMIFVGTGLWFAYGLLIKDFPLILANVITCALSGVLFFMKIRNMK